VRTINLSTVYRAIKSLTAEGVIHAVEIPGEPPRYEPAHLDHHHHFRCDRCDRVFDIPGCHATHIDTHLPEGFLVRMHEVVLYGTCADCGGRAASVKRARRSQARDL
jgi:Fur family ferric uptake transcriptional regulator